MIWIILGIVIGIALFIGGYEKLFGTCFGAILGGLIGLMIAVFAGSFIYDHTELVLSHKVTLESLVDGSDIHGQFFLGTGVINRVSVFTWYEQTGDNAFEQRKANANNSTVHFVKVDQQPYYVKSVRRFNDNSLLKFWGINSNGGTIDSKHYDFYVPQGAIKHNYTLDAQ